MTKLPTQPLEQPMNPRQRQKHAWVKQAKENIWRQFAKRHDVGRSKDELRAALEAHLNPKA